MKDVPYIVHEGEVARLERVIKRLFVLCIVSICFLVATNAYWIWYEQQFEDVVTSEEITQTNADGYNNYIGNDGDINNGNSEDKTSDTEKAQENRR